MEKKKERKKNLSQKQVTKLIRFQKDKKKKRKKKPISGNTFIA